MPFQSTRSHERDPQWGTILNSAVKFQSTRSHERDPDCVFSSNVIAVNFNPPALASGTRRITMETVERLISIHPLSRAGPTPLIALILLIFISIHPLSRAGLSYSCSSAAFSLNFNPPALATRSRKRDLGNVSKPTTLVVRSVKSGNQVLRIDFRPRPFQSTRSHERDLPPSGLPACMQQPFQSTRSHERDRCRRRCRFRRFSISIHPLSRAGPYTCAQWQRTVHHFNPPALTSGTETAPTTVTEPPRFQSTRSHERDHVARTDVRNASDFNPPALTSGTADSLTASRYRG